MFDIDVVITAVIGLVTTVTSGWASYFFTRKKYNSEVDLNLIEKMQGSLDFYMKLSEDNKRILAETMERLKASEKRNDALEAEIRDLRNQVFSLMAQVCTDLSCTVRKVYMEDKKSKCRKEEVKKEK